MARRQIKGKMGERKPVNFHYQTTEPDEPHAKVKVLTKNQKVLGKYVFTFKDTEYNAEKPPQTHYFDTQEEGRVTIKGCTILNDKMSDVKQGEVVEVIYLGKGKPKKGRKAPFMFDVFVIDPDDADEESDDNTE